MGLEPEAPESALWQQSVELFRDLAHDLGLPAEATSSQLKGGVEALKAGNAEMASLQEELAALKDRLAEETSMRAVEEALVAGKISPAQKDAKPLGFW